MTESFKAHSRNLMLASLGATLEYYDFVVYVFVAAAIGQAFFPADVSPWIRQIQAFSIYAIGYLVRPVAGIVIAHFADRIGRKRLFVFTVLLMSVPTFAMGLLPTYAQVGWWAPLLLLLLRILQGCAVGGELPSAAVFVSEHAPPRRLGFASGTLHGVVHCGLLLGTGGAALGAFAASLDPSLPSLTWRLPFLLGGAFGLTAAYLRRHLEETPLFAELRREKAVERAPLRTVFARHGGACLVGLGLMFMMALTSAVYFQYLATYLITQFHVPQTTVFTANIVGVLALAGSMPLWGILSDRIGPSRVVLIGATLSALASVWFFTTLPSHVGSGLSLALSLVPVGLTGGCVIALVPGTLASLFPTAVRQSGYAVPYNCGAALFAGLAPLFLSWFVRDYGLLSPMYVFLCACAVAFVTGLALRYTPRYLGPSAARSAEAATMRVRLGTTS